ncbi:MAG: aminotransferase class I/II-fold pyridoxal phosphate-dependent enzyme [Betaproteobacteria bacterium]|nr:aminotransferase class I/II-fold pyridoxal phosphate-dependent enzyme [Betaproteobacteria bacterium]
MKPPVSKLPRVGTTIFTTMSALAQEVGAVNLGQGFPDFDCDARLLDMMNAAMRAGFNQYPPMTGILELREEIAKKVFELYGRQYDVAAEITITAGATQAIQTALTAIVHPGDEVIIFEPVYDSYEPVIRLNGGVPVYARLAFPDYRPDWNAVRALITPRTRAIMINTPHNPTATLWPRADMEALADLLRGTDIMLISDEVYEHMVYDGEKHLSVASFPDLAERAFVISSFGKTYHVTGWKIAYCLAPKELMTEFRKAHQFVVFTVHTPSQHAIAHYIRLGTHKLLSDFYQAKRDFFLRHMKASRFQWQPSRATYFVSASYAHLPEFEHLSEAEFAAMLARKMGVACIPVSAFYREAEDHRVVRFCFAKKEETLARAAERLEKL